MAPTPMPRRSTRLSKASSIAAPSQQPSSTPSNPNIDVPKPSKPKANKVAKSPKPSKDPKSSKDPKPSKDPKSSKVPKPSKDPKSSRDPRSSNAAPPETIEFPSPSSFNAWLLQHGLTTPQGIWLQIAKKTSPTRSITYDQAVDTALCHGWIDGQRRALSPSHFTQRFTPRRKKSLWSRRNVDKVAVLTAQGRMQPAGLAEVRAAMADGRWERAYEGSATMQVPGDFEEALRGSEPAREAFGRLGRGERYPFLWRIVTLHGEARARKIAVFVDMLARGEKL